MAGSNHRTRPPAARLLQQAFGERLRWLRLAWEEREPGRHSQEAWAAVLGVDRAAISRWETGRFPMPVDLVWRVVMAMGVTWDYLYGGLIGPGIEPWLADHLTTRYPAATVEQRELLDLRRDALRLAKQERHSRPAVRLGRPPTKRRRRSRSAAPPRQTPGSPPPV